MCYNCDIFAAAQPYRAGEQKLDADLHKVLVAARTGLGKTPSDPRDDYALRQIEDVIFNRQGARVVDAERAVANGN